jgi:site-specific DNA-methyltransferase (adenine-specific)
MEIKIDNIYNCDCLEGMKAMADGSVDCVVTSPPYDNLRKYGGVAEGWNFDKFKAIAQQIARVLKQGGVCVWVVSDGVVNGSETGTSFRQALYFMECGLTLYDTMIWEKPSPQAPTEGRYYDVFEYMFIICKGKKPASLNFICDHKNVSAGTVSTRETRSCAEDRKPTDKKRVVKDYSRRFNVWQISRDNGGTGHPAVFPFRLAHDHILSWSEVGGVVLDPFLGSGTTCVAALREHRHFLGFELNKEYFDIAQRRIALERQQPQLDFTEDSL